jgi:hypothetical protein
MYFSLVFSYAMSLFMPVILKHNISEGSSSEVRTNSPWHDDYTRLNRRDIDRQAIFRERSLMLNSLKRHMRTTIREFKEDGFDRMERCRMALRVLDENGWMRSHHQKIFHEAYIRAVSRVFFKADGEGAFMRSHQRLLQANGWSHIQSEVLISTPRRFGKTISVSLFAAALIFSCTSCEVSIYSTCKRISQKLLRNVLRFLNIIFDALKVPKYKVVRENCEEIILNGPDGVQDIRIVNSYPSRVLPLPTPLILDPTPSSLLRVVNLAGEFDPALLETGASRSHFPQFIHSHIGWPIHYKAPFVSLSLAARARAVWRKLISSHRFSASLPSSMSANVVCWCVMLARRASDCML